MYLEQVAPHYSKKGDNTTTTPAPTSKASGTMSISDQRRGQKWGAGDLFGDVAGLEPTASGNNEQASLRAKKGKSSLKSDKQATGHNLETTRCPAKMVKTKGIQRTGMFTHNI